MTGTPAAPTPDRTAGIHHVTAIAGDPQGNLYFYRAVLGLRLVKRTVNFDDPGSYHFYFGDERGSPGAIMTFFPWPGAPRGTRGSGSVTASAFSVPVGSLAWWAERLGGMGVGGVAECVRFGQRVLAFEDHDGTALELIETPGVERLPAFTGGGVVADRAVRGFHSVTLSLRSVDHTAGLLTRHLGLSAARVEGARVRFAADGGTVGTLIDLLHTPDLPPGESG
ncbi:MAG: VOC family protein, partial [Phycisphaerales bacterium]|nr:VOC family protein [Phycisphaerales bacterium]